MKSLIIYSSKSGNTKKLADTIYNTLSGEKDIFPIDQSPSLEGYDRIFIGFWFQAGKPDPETCKYLEQTENAPSAFLFATHGAAAGSDHVKNALSHARGLINDADVIGTFTCQGEVNPKVLEKIKQKPEPPVWIGDAADAIGHPDESDTTALEKVISDL